MLGYISSTRKKSCFACVKSKRRCDLGYPFCKRCFVKGIDCKYPNATPRETSNGSGVVPAEVVIRQTTPDISQLPATSGVENSSSDFSFVNATLEDVAFDPLFFQSYTSSDSSGSSSSPESFQDAQIPEDWSVEPPPPPALPQLTLTRMLSPEILVPAWLSRAQVNSVINNLCNFVPSMAYSGSTVFLHKNLWQTYEPQEYQDCVAISALFMNKTARNQRILANTIGTKISAMIGESATWTLSQHLAAVQAMIIYQVIRLFDADLGLQPQAEKDNELLELWTAHLWKRFFNEPQSFSTPYDSFVFNESLRRTTMMAVFTRCGYTTLTRGGLATQVPVLARLPFSKDFGAWKCDPEEWSMRSLGYLGEEEALINYGDWADQWSPEKGLEGIDGFGKMLLTACRGKEDARLLD